jgi:hypothetical protein
MRSMHARLGVALVLAMILATVPVSIDLGGRANGIDAGHVARLLSPTLPAWADDEIEIDDVEKVKRGEKNVTIRADVEKSGLICKLKIKYADGNVDTVGDDETDKDGICVIRFDVPDRKSVVGDAIAKLTVETKKGADRGRASRYFSIRDRRGG